GSIITGNTTEDLQLVFGSRVRFQGGTGGNISCDGTVLVRGDASCSTSSSQMALSSNDDGLLRPENEGLLGEMRPFPLIP
ncbi:MAG TPA: hypothetical protein VMS12_05800, partial [Thermoanaerobaculia bacterium]|nr:hypothetical protein [Thermoanaerobaculia bacterium]